MIIFMTIGEQIPVPEINTTDEGFGSDLSGVTDSGSPPSLLKVRLDTPDNILFLSNFTARHWAL